MVLLANAVVNTLELFSSLLSVIVAQYLVENINANRFDSFQEVQGYSALQASLRILPNMLLGIATNFLTGTFVSHIHR